MPISLEETLVNVINDVTQSVSTAKNFLVSEIPDVIQQLIMWKTCKYAILAVAAVIIFSLAFRYFRAVLTISNKKDCTKKQLAMVKNWNCYGSRSDEEITSYELKDSTVFTSAICVVLMVLTGIVFLQVFFDLIQIIVAPKVWLIEYAADLVQHKQTK